MIYFLTSTELPIEAATTMGVSVKDGDNAIGKFGTGLKYAVAGILRLRGSIEIMIGADRYIFTAKPSVIRGKEFSIVHCNDMPCGFTTELGKHWEPWQLFRELASNTLDEGGEWVDRAFHCGGTTIAVSCRELEQAAKSEAVFLGNPRALVTSRNGATIYEGQSRHYYYKGIRAGSFPCVAPVTVSVNSGTLSEDRLLDLATVEQELAWAFRTATSWDEALLLDILPDKRPDSFWVRHMQSYSLDTADLPKEMMAFIAARPKFIHHPGFSLALKKYQKKQGVARWVEIPMTQRHMDLVALGESVAARAGVDPIPQDRIHFTKDLDDATLAVTCMDTRHVWFSTKLALLGEGEFLSGYIEEAMHAMTGFRDCTREFQNAMLAMIVTLARSAP